MKIIDTHLLTDVLGLEPDNVLRVGCIAADAIVNLWAVVELQDHRWHVLSLTGRDVDPNLARLAPTGQADDLRSGFYSIQPKVVGMKDGTPVLWMHSQPNASDIMLYPQSNQPAEMSSEWACLSAQHDTLVADGRVEEVPCLVSASVLADGRVAWTRMHNETEGLYQVVVMFMGSGWYGNVTRRAYDRIVQVNRSIIGRWSVEGSPYAQPPSKDQRRWCVGYVGSDARAPLAESNSVIGLTVYHEHLYGATMTEYGLRIFRIMHQSQPEIVIADAPPYHSGLRLLPRNQYAYLTLEDDRLRWVTGSVRSERFQMSNPVDQTSGLFRSIDDRWLCYAVDGDNLLLMSLEDSHTA